MITCSRFPEPYTQCTSNLGRTRVSVQCKGLRKPRLEEYFTESPSEEQNFLPFETWVSSKGWRLFKDDTVLEYQYIELPVLSLPEQQILVSSHQFNLVGGHMGWRDVDQLIFFWGLFNFGLVWFRKKKGSSCCLSNGWVSYCAVRERYPYILLVTTTEQQDPFEIAILIMCLPDLVL